MGRRLPNAQTNGTELRQPEPEPDSAPTTFEVLTGINPADVEFEFNKEKEKCEF